MGRSRNSSDIWGRAISLTTRDLRLRARLSYKRFGELSGIDSTKVSYLEHNEVRVWPQTIEYLARGHGMTATEFMAHAETKLARLRKQEPDPFLATVTRRRLKKKTPGPKAGGNS